MSRTKAPCTTAHVMHEGAMHHCTCHARRRHAPLHMSCMKAPCTTAHVMHEGTMHHGTWHAPRCRAPRRHAPRLVSCTTAHTARPRPPCVGAISPHRSSSFQKERELLCTSPSYLHHN
eukprot:365158-Chlamydomonas_euryale.AAC.3